MPRPDSAVPGSAKAIAAWTALVIALSGAVELRVKVGTMSDRLDRVEKILEDRYARNP